MCKILLLFYYDILYNLTLEILLHYLYYNPHLANLRRFIT
jgi:hypothetical protein